MGGSGARIGITMVEISSPNLWIAVVQGLRGSIPAADCVTAMASNKPFDFFHEQTFVDNNI